MKKVLDQYFNHILRLANKPPSDNRSKGLAYYTAAAECLTAVINAPKTAWVDLQFGKKSAFE